MSAPLLIAIDATAKDLSNLSSGLSFLIDKKDFLDKPIKIGISNTLKLFKRLIIVSLSEIVLPNPIPGSIIICFLLIPCFKQNSILFSKKDYKSSITSLYFGLFCIFLGLPFICIKIIGILASLTIFNI